MVDPVSQWRTLANPGTRQDGVHSELRDDSANQRLRVQCHCPSVLSARSGKVKLLAIGLPLVHTLFTEY